MLSIRLRFFIGFILALILSILPLPQFLSVFRPPWVLLFLLYIQFYMSEKFTVLSVFILGFILDILLSTIIGEHSFVLLLITWIALSKVRRFQFFSMTQQLLFISFLCFAYQFLIAFIDVLLGFQYNLYQPFAVAIAGVFFWLWIRLLGEDLLLPSAYR